MAEFAAGDERVRLFRNERNLGPIRNWKNCLAQARGKYAHWLWSDDYIESGFYSTWARLHASGGADCLQVAAFLRSETTSEVVHSTTTERMSFKTIIETAPKQLQIPAFSASYVLPTVSLNTPLTHRDFWKC